MEAEVGGGPAATSSRTSAASRSRTRWMTWSSASRRRTRAGGRCSSCATRRRGTWGTRPAGGARCGGLGRDAPRDHLTDCRACDLDDELDHHLDRGEYASRRWRRPGPCSRGASGARRCPHLTLGHGCSTRSSSWAGWTQARDCHLRGYALVRAQPGVPRHRGRAPGVPRPHGQRGAGPEALRAAPGWALEHASHRYRFTFFAAALTLLDRAGVEGRERVSLTLPRAFPQHSPGGTYETRALRDWLAAQHGGDGGEVRHPQWDGPLPPVARARAGPGEQVRPFPIEEPPSA